MKSRLPIFAFVALCAVVVHAIPQSPVITYGMIRDEYGNPLKASSALSLNLVRADAPDGQVYATATVGDTVYSGMNYRLSLEIDSAGPSRPYAVLEGTEMKIKFLIGGEEQAVTPSPVFATPANGTAQRKDYSLGTDADGDGMPDAWEKWALEVGGLSSDAAAIAALKPDDDSDGDGMSNGREFLAGTDPFLVTDIFAISHFVKTGAGNRTEIKFSTVPGRTYRVVTSTALDGPTWVPVATTRTVDGEAVYATYAGTGRDITLYIDTTSEDSAFFKVVAQ